MKCIGLGLKNASLPKKFTVPKSYLDRIQSGLNVGVGRRNRHYRIILVYQTWTEPNSSHGQVFHFIKPYGKSQKNFKFGSTKTNLSAKQKLLQENVFRPLTVKIMDEYETQTHHSGQNLRTQEISIHDWKSWNIHNNNWNQKISYGGVLKKINHSECASPMFTVSKTYQTLRSITDLKELNKKIVTRLIQS
jgi:hypothetical protein